MKILLASGSPRRLALLRGLGHEVTVVKPDFDESRITLSDPALLVTALAVGKGRSVRPPAGMLLVAADTVVCCEGRILGKPADEKEAFAVLRMLSGRTHNVFTGVYLERDGKNICFTDCAEVRFRDLSDQEILGYIATGSPFDKAGGYGVQDSDFVAEITGSYHNVMGFPTERFEELCGSI